jgi:hypothetical protein
MKITILAGSILLLLAMSCKKEAADTGGTGTVSCTGVTSTFSLQVQPLINTYCATNSGCHASGSVRGPGALLNYTQVFNNRSAIRSSVANGSMPQGTTLTSAQKSLIICWIDGGAPDN